MSSIKPGVESWGRKPSLRIAAGVEPVTRCDTVPVYREEVGLGPGNKLISWT